MVDIKFKEGNDLFNYRVAAIIESNGKYLFQKMNGDEHFTLVGGRVHFMETTKEAIKREILEEVGYDISDDEFFVSEIAENFFDYVDGDGIVHNVQTLLFIYKVKIKQNKKLKYQREFKMKDKSDTTLHWVDYQEAKNSVILPMVSKRLLDEDKLCYEIINDRKYTE